MTVQVFEKVACDLNNHNETNLLVNPSLSTLATNGDFCLEEKDIAAPVSEQPSETVS